MLCEKSIAKSLAIRNKKNTAVITDVHFAIISRNTFLPKQVFNVCKYKTKFSNRHQVRFCFNGLNSVSTVLPFTNKYCQRWPFNLLKLEAHLEHRGHEMSTRLGRISKNRQHDISLESDYFNQIYHTGQYTQYLTAFVCQKLVSNVVQILQATTRVLHFYKIKA